MVVWRNKKKIRKRETKGSDVKIDKDENVLKEKEETGKNEEKTMEQGRRKRKNKKERKTGNGGDGEDKRNRREGFLKKGKM